MKQIYTFYIALIIIPLVACDEWLNVQPEDQTSEEQLYSKCEGYYNQLNGLYRKCSAATLYGKELSWGLIDVLAQYYDMDYYTTACKNFGYREASGYNYDYDRTKAMVTAIWEQGYNVIANSNNLIANTEVADSNLFPYFEKERKVILGEAYAIRAMVHFDMLRLYAPHPAKDIEGRYIPYVRTFPTHVPLKERNIDVMNYILEDLKRAMLLTEAFDTTLKGNISDESRRLELVGGGKDRFLSYRGYRMHHYAIIGLLARVYLYMEDYDNALLYAKKLTDIHAEKRWFRFTTSTYDVTKYGNIKLYGDVIFAFYNNNVTEYAIEESPSDEYYLSIMDYDGIFNVDEDRDIRRHQWGTSADGNRIPLKYKWQQDSETKGEVSNLMIPMIRLSEMYYIAAECFYRNDQFDKAYAYLNYVRTQRKLIQPLPETTSIDEFLTLIENEVRRELYGEGQLFFFYKRLNRPVLTSGSDKLTLNREFVLPIPNSNDL